MKDYCLRIASKNGEVRGFFSTSRNMVEAARAFHNTTKVATAALGRTLTATSMMGLMMKNPNDKITIIDRKSTRLNSSHANISYAVFCLKKKKISIFDLLFMYTI